jgi:hypothetical protein
MPLPKKSPTPPIVQPDIGLGAAAGLIGPEDIGDAVAEEIADPSDCPAAAGMCAETDAGGPLPIVDLPLVHEAGGRILPQDVARTIAVEIADADDVKQVA